MKLGFVEYFKIWPKSPNGGEIGGRGGGKGGEGEKKAEGGGRKRRRGRKRKEGEGEEGKGREGGLDQPIAIFFKVQKDLVCLQTANPGFSPDIDFFRRA